MAETAGLDFSFSPHPSLMLSVLGKKLPGWCKCPEKQELARYGAYTSWSFDTDNVKHTFKIHHCSTETHRHASSLALSPNWGWVGIGMGADEVRVGDSCWTSDLATV